MSNSRIFPKKRYKLSSKLTPVSQIGSTSHRVLTSHNLLPKYTCCHIRGQVSPNLVPSVPAAPCIIPSSSTLLFPRTDLERFLWIILTDGRTDAKRDGSVKINYDRKINQKWQVGGNVNSSNERVR